MAYNKCIFMDYNPDSDTHTSCNNKPEYIGDIYSSWEGSDLDGRKVKQTPMIDFLFCKKHYENGKKISEYKFKNVEHLILGEEEDRKLKQQLDDLTIEGGK